MAQWLGVAGTPDILCNLRIPGNPQTFKPGDEVPLSDEQMDALRRDGHLFIGDAVLVQTPGGDN